MPEPIRRTCLAWIVLVVMGCGGGAASSSGLDPSKKLIDLTDDEKGQFCDWAVSRFGGYGATCNADWAFMEYPDRESCVRDGPSLANTPSCQTTVEQAEACVESVSRCTTFAELKSSPVCSPMTVC